jgi:uncharacterized membrane protein HdeD (DUF308 family)
MFPTQAEAGFLGSFASNWMAVAVRGVAALLLGVAALALPGLTLLVLVTWFGAWAIVSGISAIVSGIRGHGGRPNWLLIIGGIAGIVAGIVALVLPGITALGLLLVIGTWAVVSGVFEIAAAITMRNEIANEWLLALNGVVSVLFGVVVIVFPGAGALALVGLIAAYAIFSGVVLLALAFRLRAHHGARAVAGSAQRGVTG